LIDETIQDRKSAKRPRIRGGDWLLRPTGTKGRVLFAGGSEWLLNDNTNKGRVLQYGYDYQVFIGYGDNGIHHGRSDFYEAPTS
jgi:hypothetical protein